MKRFIYLICITLLAFGCRPSDPVIREVNMDTLEFADFVEPEFPFITTSLDLRQLGDPFPKVNYLPRALAVRLGEGAYLGFDIDLLRWSVAWTGEFVSMTSMAQVSYKDFFNKRNSFPKILGTAQLATGIYPGWTNYRPDFKDPRSFNSTDSLKWGALPSGLGRWKGVFVDEEKAILSYTVGGVDIYEMPGARSFQNECAFTRTFKIGPVSDSLYSVVADFNDIIKTNVENKITYLYHGPDGKQVTAIGLAGTEIAAKVYVQDNEDVVLALPPAAASQEITLMVWTGPVEKKADFEKALAGVKVKMPAFEKGGSPYWKETIYTQGKLAPDTSAFVLDELTLPLPNPWKRNVRVADIAFYTDGRAAVVTFEGDVWILENIDAKLKKLSWKRYASGLYEPMSIGIHENLIYVFGKEGIVRLHDLNDDGAADFYENFSPRILQSMDSREWPADMKIAADGTVFIAKGGGAIPPTSPSMLDKRNGFQSASFQAGTIVKLSPDGERAEILATGLRAPYMGYHPERGLVSVSDQQGNYVPATPLYLMDEGDYFGVLSAIHHKDNLPIKRPLTWIPHSVDRSSTSQVWIGDKMGPLSQSMVHFSFGRPGLFSVVIDSTAKVKQGGVSYIEANYDVPVLKGVVHPRDGQLYVGGFNLWGSNAKGVSALRRLRYTGKAANLPIGVRIGQQGLILSFSRKLDRQMAEDAGNFQIKRWNYERTEKYGSGHFKLNGEPGEEVLPIRSTHLSKDGKSVFIVVPDMKEVMQMQLDYRLASEEGTSIASQFNFSVNDAGKIDLGASGFEQIHLGAGQLHLTEAEVIALSSQDDTKASIEKGAKLFKKMACIGCHSIENKTDGMYGPPLQDVYKAQREFEDGSKGIADDAYLKESILKPNVKVVKGYGDEMPSFVGVLSDEDLESMVLYLKSLARR